MRHLRESVSCGKEYGNLDQLAKEVSKAKHAAREKRRRDNLKKVDAEAVLKDGAARVRKHIAWRTEIDVDGLHKEWVNRQRKHRKKLSKRLI